MGPFCKMIKDDSAKKLYQGLVLSRNLPKELFCPVLSLEFEFYREKDMLGGEGLYFIVKNGDD